MINKDKDKIHEITEAIELVKKTCKCKFDSTIEVHINMGIDVKKADQALRFAVSLPNGTGQTKKVAVIASKTIKDADIQLTEEDLVKIENGQIRPKIDFDVLVAEPKFMPKLAKLGKILGPAGMMPNPKSGTVSEDCEKAVQQIKKGKVEVRNEPNAPILHSIIGKRSFETKKLVENFEELMGSIKSHRPQKVKIETYIKTAFIKSTMSESVRVA